MLRSFTAPNVAVSISDQTMSWVVAHLPDHRRFRLLCVFLSPLRVVIPHVVAQLLAPFFRPIITNVPPGRESLDQTTVAIHRVRVRYEGNKRSPSVPSLAAPRKHNRHWHQLVGMLLGFPRVRLRRTSAFVRLGRPRGNHQVCCSLPWKTFSFPRGPTRRPAVPCRSWSFCLSRLSFDSLFFLYSERDPSASLNTTISAGRGYG